MSDRHERRNGKLSDPGRTITQHGDGHRGYQGEASAVFVGSDAAMSRRRYESSSGGGGFVGLIGVLFIIGLIIKFIWWIIGAAALVGLFYLIRAILEPTPASAPSWPNA